MGDAGRSFAQGRCLAALAVIGLVAAACGSGDSSQATLPPYQLPVHAVLSDVKGFLGPDRQQLVGRVTIYYTTKQTVDILLGKPSDNVPRNSSPAIVVYGDYAHMPRNTQSGATSSGPGTPIEIFIENNGLDIESLDNRTPPADLPPGIGRPTVVNL